MGDLVEQQAVERVRRDVRQSRPAAHGRALPGERLVADDDHPLGAERQRGRDRRVQARGPVHVVAGGAQRRGDLDGREHERDRRRRAHVLAFETRVDVLDLAVRAGRFRALSTNPTGTPRSSDVATTHTACTRPEATLACSASQSIQPSRLRASGAGSSSEAARRPGSSSTSPARRSRPIAVPTPITGEITLPLRTERQWSRKIAACSDAGQRRDRRHDRGVDPADARPAHDLHLLAARRPARGSAPTARPPRRRRARRRRGGRARSAL